MRNKRKTILVFVRVPEPGRVKTRLVGKLDPEGVCRLYQCFVEDVLETLSTLEHDIVVCYDPPEGGLKMISWLGPSFNFIPQSGASLGKRMENAFTAIYAQGADQAVLIGSDLPDLDARIIDGAFEGLETHDSVLGPAVDGGYYLIGFNAGSFLPEIFQGISWGSPQVFAATADIAKKNNLSLQLLPEWRDIDTYDDLKAFFLRAAGNKATVLKTMEYLRRKQAVLKFEEN